MEVYLIVAFLMPEPKEVFLSNDWPLHVTIVRPFLTDMNVGELSSRTSKICEASGPINARAIARVDFGLKSGRLVTEIDKTAQLLELHNNLLDSLAPNIQFKPPRHDFRPHVTDQRAGQVGVGEMVLISNLSLVKEEGRNRKIVRTHKL